MRRPILVLALFLLPSTSGFANAQTGPARPYIWTNVKVGAGGFIPGIVFSRVEKDLAYLRSDMGGAYRWDHDAQRWIPMHDDLGESSYFGTESIAQPSKAVPTTTSIATGTIAFVAVFLTFG